MTDNRKYIKRGQALIIWDDPQRYEKEVAGANKNKVRCAVPVRRVAVCGNWFPLEYGSSMCPHPSITEANYNYYYYNNYYNHKKKPVDYLVANPHHGILIEELRPRLAGSYQKCYCIIQVIKGLGSCCPVHITIH